MTRVRNLWWGETGQFCFARPCKLRLDLARIVPNRFRSRLYQLHASHRFVNLRATLPSRSVLFAPRETEVASSTCPIRKGSPMLQAVQNNNRAIWFSSKDCDK